MRGVLVLGVVGVVGVVSVGCGTSEAVVTTPDTTSEVRPAVTASSVPSMAPTFANAQLAGGVDLAPACPAGERAAFIVIDPGGSCVLTKPLPKEAASRCVPASTEAGPPAVTCSIGAFGLIYVSMEGRKVGPDCAVAISEKFANPPTPLSACGG